MVQKEKDKIKLQQAFEKLTIEKKHRLKDEELQKKDHQNQAILVSVYIIKLLFLENIEIKIFI